MELETNLNDDRRMGRLVDGELSPEEYRALVASFDDEPGAWRRCALAFLEAQALGFDLSHIRRTFDFSEPAPTIHHSPLTPSHHSPLTTHHSLHTVLAIAAS